MAEIFGMLVSVLVLVIGSVGAGDHRQRSGDLLISEVQRREILKIHNDLRRLQNAADMEYMVWSESLANISLATAEMCTISYGNEAEKQMTSQNMAFISSRNLSEMMSAVKGWYDDTYNITTGRCKQSAGCDHHLQLIWSATNKVGCAYSMCDLLLNREANQTSTNITLFVCTYYPGLAEVNISRAPFVVGMACSQCASGADWCDTTEPRGLCRRDCSDEAVECVMSRKLTPDSNQIRTSWKSLVSGERLPSSTASTLDTNTVTRTNNTRHLSTANEIIASLSGNSDGVEAALYQTTRRVRSDAADIESGSDVSTPSTTIYRRTGVSEVSGSWADRVNSRYTSAGTQSFLDSTTPSAGTARPASSPEASSTDVWLTRRRSTARDYQTETGPASTRARTTASSTATVRVTSFLTTQQSHSVAYDSTSPSNDSTTQTSAGLTRRQLYATTSYFVNNNTEFSHQSSSAPDIVTNTASATFTSLHHLLPTTTTTHDVYVDAIQLNDMASAPSKTFWITVVLIVSIDSVLIIAIVVTTIVIVKRKEDADKIEQIDEHADTESNLSESKYYHFELDPRNEETA